MNIEIRSMTEQDWPQVLKIYMEGIEEGRSTFEKAAPTYEQWDKGHLADCRFVAAKDGKVYGWIALSPTSSREVFSGVVEVSVYVGCEHQHKGIGKRLMQRLCTEAESSGYWCLYSSIFSINEGSIRLHKSCGFREIGYRERIARDRFGNWQNTVIMEKRNGIE